MEVDRASVGILQESIVLVREQPHHRAGGPGGVGLDVPASLARGILDAPDQGIESVADGNMDILVRPVLWWIAVDGDFTPWQLEVEADVIELAGPLAAVRARTTTRQLMMRSWN